LNLEPPQGIHVEESRRYRSASGSWTGWYPSTLRSEPWTPTHSPRAQRRLLSAIQVYRTACSVTARGHRQSRTLCLRFINHTKHSISTLQPKDAVWFSGRIGRRSDNVYSFSRTYTRRPEATFFSHTISKYFFLTFSITSSSQIT